MAQLVDFELGMEGLPARDTHFIGCLVLVPPRKTGNHPSMTENC